MFSASRNRPWDVHRPPSAEGGPSWSPGANAGIGHFVAEQLAGTGVVVVPGSRDAAKADAAMASIHARVSGARVRHLRPDLADRSSLRAAVDRLDRDHRSKRAYGRSRPAQMCFGFELDRRPRAGDGTVLSVVARPGGALDSLTPSRPPVRVTPPGERLRGLPAGLLVQGKDAGAWPVVRAVLDPVVRGRQLWGPGVFGLRGTPRREPVPSHMADRAVAARLWAAGVELAGADPHLGFR